MSRIPGLIAEPPSANRTALPLATVRISRTLYAELVISGHRTAHQFGYLKNEICGWSAELNIRCCYAQSANRSMQAL